VTATLPSAQLIVDTAELVGNWRRFAAASGRATAGAAIKADGYGLGAVAVLHALAAAGLRDAFVAHWSEVAALGPIPAGVRVAVLHGVAAGEMATALASPARPVLVTPAQVAAWRSTGRPCDVMVDTGLNRLGLTPEEAVSGLLEGLAINTLHSHLACAEEPQHALNEAQRAAFAALVPRIPARRHALANSGGIVLGDGYCFDLTRPGIGLYGGGAGPDGMALHPVARLAAPVIQLRDVPVGDTVGYGATFVATRPTRLAIVALGYADGYPRGASGKGWASVEGVICPQVGRVAMDLTAFDVTDAASVAEGMMIEVGFDLATLSAASGRSEYELLTGLGRRYARVYR
jgi:alanine racemase